MKIKRFVAPDMREGLRLVKEELGADAVILSNQRVDQGVEIVAAMDYDARVIEKAAEEKESALDRQLDKELADDTLSLDWTVPIEQNYREDYTPKRPEKKVQTPSRQDVASEKKSAPVRERQKQPEWIEDPAISAVKNELEMLRKEFKTQLNELSWADKANQNPVRIDIIRRLLDTGFSKRLSVKVAESVTTQTDLETAWLMCLKLISNSLPVDETPLLDEGGLVALVGPTGVGKTTTIAKIAARFRMKHGADQLALITTDNYRIGAHEQLNNFARILGVPMRVATTAEELHDALTDFSEKRLVLIDSAGMSQRDIRMTEQFKLLNNDEFNIENYLVIAGTTEARAMREVVQTFSDASPTGCILTKIDEIDCPGAALSAIIENQLPLKFVCDGQRVPEDLHLPMVYDLLEAFIDPQAMLEGEDFALSVLLDQSSHHAYV